MSVGTIFSSMTKLFIDLLLSVRTPNSFILIHIEKAIVVENVNHLNLNFALRVCKRAEVSILTLINFFGIFSTKLAFISAWMIELLNFIVRKQAFFVVAFLLIAKNVAVLDL
jgi:hypothetical protein